MKTTIEKNNAHASDLNKNENIDQNKRNSNNKQKTKSTDYLEILGIKLHFDDILLILLIYFLYTEGVKDIYLFFVLILLLLS